MNNKIQIRRPSSRHSHLREGLMLKDMVSHNNIYQNVLCMPNLTDPVDDVFKFHMYRQQILKNSPQFIPTLGLMLTKNITPDTIRRANDNGAVFLKWIPSAASTNSQNGVAIDDIREYSACLIMLQELKMPFLVHLERAEYPNSFTVIDVEREIKAIPTAQWLVENFPGLKIVFEHASTKELLRFVELAPANVIATLTVHHALKCYEDAYDKFDVVKDLFLFCRPSLKRIDDVKAVRQAITSGNYKKFRFGPDDAPHLRIAKLKATPGIFMPSQIALPLLTQIFEERGCLAHLEGFTAVNPTDIEFYDWDFTMDMITLVKEEWTIPEEINGIVPFMARQKLSWKIVA